MAGETSTYRSRDDLDSRTEAPRFALVQAATGDDLFGGRERLILPGPLAVIGRSERDDIATAGDMLEIGLADRKASARHARLSTTDAGLMVEDLDSTNGTRIDGVRVRTGTLAPGGVLEIGQTFFVCAPLPPGFDALTAADARLGPTRTLTPALIADLTKLARIARATVSVLVQGESGTGKELLARQLHAASGRKGRLIAIHCSAIPEQMLEGELFGYRRGAFTGAERSHDGLIAAADGGTLFLDEVGEIPLPLQVKLLRVLQEREVIPLGDTHAKKVDVRLVTATHRDLQAMVFANLFRGDLLARIEGVTFTLPRLAERRGDLGLLIRHLLQKIGPQPSTPMTMAALRAIFAYSWPYNVRELEKALEVAYAVTAGERPIDMDDLPVSIRTQAVRRPSGVTATAPPQLSPADREIKARLVKALDAHRGNISAVARELGKGRTQIYRWLERFGLDAESSEAESDPS